MKIRGVVTGLSKSAEETEQHSKLLPPDILSDHQNMFSLS